jgi:MoxR-like ATPase
MLQDIDTWIDLAAQVKLSADVRAYMHNAVVFMRMHRAVASGVSPHATRHLYALTKALAPLHGLDFITPSLVALAVRKIYPHRLAIVKPDDEVSLQWGSSLEAVAEYLDGITIEDVIEDVLERVETPL